MPIAQTRSTLHTRRKNQMCTSTGRSVTCKGLSTARCSKDESLRTNSFFPSLWRGRSYNKRTLWANFDGFFFGHQSCRKKFAKLGLVFFFLVFFWGGILFFVQEQYWTNERKHTGWQWSRVSILAWCPSLQLTKGATLSSKGFQSFESNNVIFCHCHIVLLELFCVRSKRSLSVFHPEDHLISRFDFDGTSSQHISATKFHIKYYNNQMVIPILCDWHWKIL